MRWCLQYLTRLQQSGQTTAQIIRAAASYPGRDKALKQAGVTPDLPSKRGRSSAADAGPSKRIKTEVPDTAAPFPSAFPAPVSEMDIERINTVQVRHTPVTVYPMIDLTAEGGAEIGVMNVLRVPDTKQAKLVTGKQIYDPALDRRFPIRDPNNPALVHPAYAHPNDPTRCAEQVRLQDVIFQKNASKRTKWGNRSQMPGLDESTLWNMLNQHFGKDHPYQKGAGRNMKKMFIEALRGSCREEMEATINGKEPPSSASVEVVAVTAKHCDNPEEARALQGQYGGILKSNDEKKQPSLRNGRIVCLLAGARLETEEDRAAYFAHLGKELGEQAHHDYSAQVRKYGSKQRVDWAPYGGGNMCQYFNSAFGADGKVATKQCNACFLPVTFKLHDREGQERLETMMAVILYQSLKQDHQIRLNYGRKYALPQEEPAPMEAEAP